MEKNEKKWLQKANWFLNKKKREGSKQNKKKLV